MYTSEDIQKGVELRNGTVHWIVDDIIVDGKTTKVKLKALHKVRYPNRGAVTFHMFNLLEHLNSIKSKFIKPMYKIY